VFKTKTPIYIQFKSLANEHDSMKEKKLSATSLATLDLVLLYGNQRPDRKNRVAYEKLCVKLLANNFCFGILFGTFTYISPNSQKKSRKYILSKIVKIHCVWQKKNLLIYIQ